jgi:hypothetical protein
MVLLLPLLGLLLPLPDPRFAGRSAVFAVDAFRTLITGWAWRNTSPEIVSGNPNGEIQHQRTTGAATTNRM